MSMMSSIDFKLSEKHCKAIDRLGVIESIIESGWKCREHDGIHYLPLGDQGEFDWQIEDISFEQLFEILRQKQECNELIGMTLLWENTDVGVILLFHADGTLSFSTNINRVALDAECSGRKLTDMNWYLERLAPAIHNAGYSVEFISFNLYL